MSEKVPENKERSVKLEKDLELYEQKIVEVIKEDEQLADAIKKANRRRSELNANKISLQTALELRYNDYKDETGKDYKFKSNLIKANQPIADEKKEEKTKTPNDNPKKEDKKEEVKH